MKKIMMVLMAAAIVSCNNGANDGDPTTDTTNMPVDSNLNNTSSDHINRSDGTVLKDSANRDSIR